VAEFKDIASRYPSTLAAQRRTAVNDRSAVDDDDDDDDDAAPIDEVARGSQQSELKSSSTPSQEEAPQASDAAASPQVPEGSAQHASSSSDLSPHERLYSQADAPRTVHRGQPDGETAPPSQFGLGAATPADQRLGAVASRMEGSTSTATGNIQGGEGTVTATAITVEGDGEADEEEGDDASPFPDVPCSLNRDVHPKERCLRVDDYACALAAVLNASFGEFCFAVYGHWGRGKTFLMQRLASMLPSSYRTIWFSAWKYRTTPETWIYLTRCSFELPAKTVSSPLRHARFAHT
jgi:hypothetical protein